MREGHSRNSPSKPPTTSEAKGRKYLVPNTKRRYKRSSPTLSAPEEVVKPISAHKRNIREGHSRNSPSKPPTSEAKGKRLYKRSSPVDVSALGKWLEFDEEGSDGEEENEDEKKGIVMVGAGICKSKKYVLPGKIAKKLYPHQRDGLQWFWKLHCEGTGGILGDDMGLGKTMQVAAFLAGLFHSRLIKKVLIVAPKTLLTHWTNELKVVGLSDKTREYLAPQVREDQLRNILKDGGILLTTYEIVRNNCRAIRGEHITWNYVMLDEGHKIKNLSTTTAQSLLAIPSDHRIIITGTPMQNNLKEFWALFHFCCPAILGNKDEFKKNFEMKILVGNDKNATAREKYVASKSAEKLRERIEPYFLRRMKSEVFNTKGAKLPKKNEIIVWLPLTKCQRQLYKAVLESKQVQSSLDSGSHLASLTILKNICNHPRILTKKAAEVVLEGINTMPNHKELGMAKTMARNLLNMADQDDDDAQELDDNVSCKISFIVILLEKLIADGHTVLIFSQTRTMLNLIQDAIEEKKFDFLRIDGTTKKTDRDKTVKVFQNGGAPIFLLTSQVGGLELTLTRADRVVIVDPAWNPSMDNQTIDRAYRLGQKRDVLGYRLITCGTIEENIYKMQVFKGGLCRTTTEHKDPTRYFSKKDIREVFSLPKHGFDISLTRQQMLEEHDQQHKMDVSLNTHIKYLEEHGSIAGVSNHNLLFSKTETVPEFEDEPEIMKSKPHVRASHGSSSSSSVEHIFNRAKIAYKPKKKPLPRKDPPDPRVARREQIKELIERNYRLLAKKDTITRLPDGGGKIQNTISDLEKEMADLDNEIADLDIDIADILGERDASGSRKK